MKRTLKALVWFVMLGSGIGTQAQEILVAPYLQPGNVSSLSKESKVVIWQTDSVAGNFKVRYAAGKSWETATRLYNAKISGVTLRIAGKMTLLYRAVLTGLEFDTHYLYQVAVGDRIIAENTFESRSKHRTTRFVAFGDCGTGSPEQKAIAYQVYQQKPQFVLIPGDVVYGNGLMLEYQKRFFPIYNSDEASVEKGVPLMRSTPFYTILGNHDVQAKDLDKSPGGLAYFYFNDLPVNAPKTQYMPEVKGKPELVRNFERATEGRFPAMSNYSFDYGNVHFTCLDANPYANPLDGQMLQWIKDDISSSRADWKIVACHNPFFNTSKSHYDDQFLRLLAPVLEQLNVNLVLTGHVHNYQRTRPLKFAPQLNEKGDRYVISDEGRVDGTFTLDEKFDGINQTKPEGVVYIVTGGGGAGLYDYAISNKPELWVHEPATNWVPYTVKLISHIHSFSLIETDKDKLQFKQLDAHGNVLDEFVMTR